MKFQILTGRFTHRTFIFEYVQGYIQGGEVVNSLKQPFLPLETVANIGGIH